MANETQNASVEATPVKATSYYEDFDTYEQNRRTALTNASDPEIEPLLTKVDYPPTIIAAKLSELNALKNLIDKQKKEYGEQYAATKNFENEANKLHAAYLKHVKFGKLIFEDDKVALKVMGLEGRRKQAEAAYCNQAISFYENGLDTVAYKNKLNARGITDAELTAGKTGYTNLKNLIPIKVKETAEAQTATELRDNAWELFEDWFIEFKKYAVLTLSETPQLREKMGWKE